MEEFAFLVNALLKSKVKGHFLMRNGCVVHNVEPFDDEDELFEAAFIKENMRLNTLLDRLGRSINNHEYDIVEFVKE